MRNNKNRLDNFLLQSVLDPRKFGRVKIVSDSFTVIKTCSKCFIQISRTNSLSLGIDIKVFFEAVFSLKTGFRDINPIFLF